MFLLGKKDGLFVNWAKPLLPWSTPKSVKFFVALNGKTKNVRSEARFPENQQDSRGSRLMGKQKLGSTLPTLPKLQYLQGIQCGAFGIRPSKTTSYLCRAVVSFCFN
ncbi:hypothetical protein AWQ23_13780 [Picosynechococcus sp. PCC 73109]|nr:hypothetical protein AWQ23_13780 [Picosynechococcus sp. PCC 73109]